MEHIGSVFGWKTGAVLLALFMLAWIYAWFVYKFLPEKRVRSSTAELVIAGTLMTLTGYGFVIGWDSTIMGWEAILSVLACFVVTGIPMTVGYIWRETQIVNRDEERAKTQMKRLNEHAKNMVKK